jgi:hypothetical protein
MTRIHFDGNGETREGMAQAVVPHGNLFRPSLEFNLRAGGAVPVLSSGDPRPAYRLAVASPRVLRASLCARVPIPSSGGKRGGE